MLVYDPSLARFYEDSFPISDDDVKRIILLFLLLLGDELERLADDASSGRITLQRLQRDVNQLIKSGYIAASLLGGGGRLSSRAAVEADLRYSLERLELFVRKIEERNFARARSAQMIRKRIRLYADYANQIFERANRAAHQTAEFNEERNVLGNAEHCPQCLSETARGWVATGTLSLPGTRICHSNCKCRLIFR